MAADGGGVSLDNAEAWDIGAALGDICEAAASVIMPFWRAGVTVRAKADDSPVTEADHQGEALILAALAERWPDIPTISEEHASEFGAPDAIGPHFFLVDPIDGTKAFVRGDKNFTVNIALIAHGRPVAGAVGAPATGELWHTGVGGAMKRVRGGTPAPIRVRAWPTGSARAVLSHTIKEAADMALESTYGYSRRELMDSSIKFCRIAEGAADIYPRHGPTMEWDIAAGHAVLAAAGGRLTTPQGDAFIYGKADQGFRNGWFVARGG